MKKDKKVGVLNIDFKLFNKIINSIKNQMEHDRKCSDAFQIILPDDFITSYNNQYLNDMMFNILKTSFNDDTKDSWIEYFIYDLEFGSKYKDGMIIEKDGSLIDISTTEKLYNFLIKK